MAKTLNAVGFGLMIGLASVSPAREFLRQMEDGGDASILDHKYIGVCSAVFSMGALTEDIEQVVFKLKALGIDEHHQLVLNGGALASSEHKLKTIPTDTGLVRVAVAQTKDELVAGSTKQIPSLLLTTQQPLPDRVLDLVMMPYFSPLSKIFNSERVFGFQIVQMHQNLRDGNLRDFKNGMDVNIRMFIEQPDPSVSAAHIGSRYGVDSALSHLRDKKNDLNLNVEYLYQETHVSDGKNILAVILKLNSLPRDSSTLEPHVIMYNQLVAHSTGQ